MQLWQRSIQWKLILSMGAALIVSLLIVVGLYTAVIDRLAKRYLVETALPASIEATRNDIERLLAGPLGAASERTGASLAAISGQVERISDVNHQVATATEEQSAVTEEINRNVQGISDLARSTAAEVRDCREQCQTLMALADALRRQMGGFKL